MKAAKMRTRLQMALGTLVLVWGASLISGAGVQDPAASPSPVTPSPSPSVAPSPGPSPLIPVEFMMKRMAVPESPPSGVPSFGVFANSDIQGVEKIYLGQCASCHGDRGQGAEVRNMGVNPPAFLRTRAFSNLASLQSFERFRKVLTEGYPGRIMPTFGSLSDEDAKALFEYLRGKGGEIR